MDRLIGISLTFLLVFITLGCQPSSEEQFYSSGQLHYTVPLRNGLKDGEMITYFENGKISLKANYKSGKLNGMTVGYDSLGNVISMIEYKNNLKHGKAEMYYSNGNIRSSAFHKEGKLNGKLLEYQENGSMSKVYYFDADSEIIYFKSFSKSGILYESLLPIVTDWNEDLNELTISLEYSEYDSAGMLILIGNLDKENKLLDTLDVFKVRDLDFNYKLKPDQKQVTGIVYELQLPEVNIGGNYFFKFESPAGASL